MSDLQIFEDQRTTILAAANHIRNVAVQSIESNGRFSIALAGGSTPKAVYELLAAESYSQQIAWENIYIFWGDERCVPPDHEDSNFRMAHEALLSQVSIPLENIFRMQGDIDPAQAAAEYEQQLRTFFDKDTLPHFDLILLGMGDDAHTASLFPETAPIHEETRWVVAHFVDKLNTWRITLTPVVINAAAQVTFLVIGDKKAQPLKQVLEGKYHPDKFPSQIVSPINGQLTWLVDQSAAKFLDNK